MTVLYLDPFYYGLHYNEIQFTELPLTHNHTHTFYFFSLEKDGQMQRNSLMTLKLWYMYPDFSIFALLCFGIFSNNLVYLSKYYL